MDAGCFPVTHVPPARTSLHDLYQTPADELGFPGLLGHCVSPSVGSGSHPHFSVSGECLSPSRGLSPCLFPDRDPVSLFQAPNRQLMAHWLQELQQRRWEYCSSLDALKGDCGAPPAPGDVSTGLVARDNTGEPEMGFCWRAAQLGNSEPGRCQPTGSGYQQGSRSCQ